MKKIIFTFSMIALVLLGTETYAQISAGIKGGINSGWAAPRPGDEDNETKIGWGIGGFLRAGIPLVGLHVQPELLITQRGAEYSRDGVTQTYTLTNIDVPVMLGKSFAAGLIHIQAGPEFTLVLNDEFEVEGGGTTVELNPDINSTLLGWQAGIGVNIPKITIDLRYQGTFSNLTDENANYRPNAIWLTVGYKFL